MRNLEKIYKKNTLFIIMMGITGFCFGLLDWDSNLVDLFYLKYNNAFLVSIISANIGTAKLLATLICIKINTSNKPNFIFSTCMILSSLIALITAICFDYEFIILFIITYLLEVLVLEIYSGYNYAYAFNSLPEERAMDAHSKRISVFKVVQATGIAAAGFICARYINNAFLIISILAMAVFAIAIALVTQVKNFPKTKDTKQDNLVKKLNIFNYTEYFRKWFFIRLLGKFALSSLIVLLSLRIIDNGLNIITLKTVKSLEWILSGIGFFLSSYFIRKKIIVKGDVFLKLSIAILLPLTFIYPNVIFVIILLDGILNPFNTMSHLEMLRYDSDNINVPQKDMLINLAGYIAKMISAYVLLNINKNISLIVIITILLISTFFEYKLYKTKKS
ncbi:MAG: hypothetical protein J1F35_01675 [Erysipelotrichales bacterium]|nr:hypothetical protein [Erysipelotrichales bacterium]